MSLFDLPGWLNTRRSAFDLWLEGQMPDVWPAAFNAPLRYPVFGGGKRVRPMLSLAAYEALAANPSDLLPAMSGAAAVELVHTYSLVHDDLPSMDDDDERRGRPTVHVAYDEATAILTGDALLTYAFTVLAESQLPAAVRIAQVQILAHEAGALGMVGGQAADVGMGGTVTELAPLTRLHSLKTGALMRASVAMGGLAAGADESQRQALDVYGRAVGLAFQLADDVLDADEDSGEDGPPSYVKLLGVDETTRRAHDAADEAMAAVANFERPEALVALAQFTVQRTY